MIFGENSRRGSSSLIVVMVVAVVALAGMLVYVTIDRNVMTVDSYIMPGSTATFEATGGLSGVSSDTTETAEMIIVGYHNDTYYILEDGRTSISLSSAEEILEGYIDEAKVSTSSIDVPGLGRTTGTVYELTMNFSDGSTSIALTTICHGMIFSLSYEFDRGSTSTSMGMRMTSSNIVLGDYPQIDSYRKIFTNSVDEVLNVDRLCESTDETYIYRITGDALTSGNIDAAYFRGDSNMIPADVNSSQTVYETSGVRISFNESGIISISYNGTFYPST